MLKKTTYKLTLPQKFFNPIPKILFGLLFINAIVSAQNKKPGEMSTSFSENSATTNINYNTGILNYNIPLLDLNLNDFSLPISLNYNAKGIKNNSVANIAGLGWNLNNKGAIISRTVRGSHADENYEGILSFPIPTSGYIDLNTNYLENVLYKNKDSESDIFTLNLPTSTVEFILGLENNQLFARPLKQTNVKIECLFTKYPAKYQIEGWKVTDTDGVQYIFEAALNSMVGYKTISPSQAYYEQAITSWVLKTIRLVNNETVDFIFDEKIGFAEIDKNSQNVFTYHLSPFKELKINDSGLNSELSSLFGTLGGLTSRYSELERASLGYINHLEGSGYEVEQINTYFTKYSNSNSQINVGTETKYVIPEATQLKIESIWDSLQFQAANFQTASSNITYQIQNILHKMFSEFDYNYSSSRGLNDYSVFPNKLIKTIKTSKLKVEFSYSEAPTSYQLAENSGYYCTKIELKTIDGVLIKKILFEMDQFTFLRKVKLVTANNQIINEYNFTYYDQDISYIKPWQTDYWGYNNGKSETGGTFPSLTSLCYKYLNHGIFSSSFSNSFWQYYNNANNNGIPIGDKDPDGTQAKSLSLKGITDYFGKKTTFDYEGNTINAPQILQGENLPFGGIRLKSITQDDGKHPALTTNYRYAFPALNGGSTPISSGYITEYSNQSFIEETAQDVMVHSSVFNLNVDLGDNSNNGFFYHYVEEIRPDGTAVGYKYPKGNSFSHSNSVSIEETRTNDLDNTLLAAIFYDSNGKIVKIKENKYSFTNAFTNHVENSWIYFSNENARPPSFMTLQIRQPKTFYNKEKLLEQYENKQIIVTTFNGSIYSYNPYWDIYMPNFSSRVVQSINNCKQYNLFGGVTKLLTETNDYTFDDYNIQNIINSSTSNYPNEKPYLYQKVLDAYSAGVIKGVINKEKIFYENSNHCFPTTIESFDSQGNSRKTKLYYAQDLNNTELINSNRLNTPIKQETYLNSSKTSTQNTVFNYFGNLYLPSKTQFAKGGDVLIDSGIIHDYYENGLVKEESDLTGKHTVYLYGYNKQYLIAKVENATFSQVAQYIPNLQNLSNFGNANSIINAFKTLRSALPETLITSYTYSPLVGITSTTLPNGLTTYYNYDSFNRLKTIKDADKNVITTHDYHFKDQP